MVEYLEIDLISTSEIINTFNRACKIEDAFKCYESIMSFKVRMGNG